MTSIPVPWSEIYRVLDLVFDLPIDQQQSLLQQECAGNPELLAAVEELLAADRASGDFLQTPAAEKAAALIKGTEDSELQSITFGAYKTTRLLGYGGMGVVYLANRIDGEFEQEVAIKCMRGMVSNPEIKRRFLAERQILASLQHPGIAHLLDGGVSEDGHPYFAMEYVRGTALTRYCDQKCLRIKERIRLFLTVCDSVSYAHSKLVIHRDLKPSNILVTTSRTAKGKAQIKLLDFGIAKFLEDDDQVSASPSPDQIKSQLLTLEYTAPEQLLRQNVTTATDVYSLGLLLYELLCGQRAHGVEDKAAEQVREIICKTMPTLPSVVAQTDSASELAANNRRNSPKSLHRRLVGDLDAIVFKALQKTPEQRYRSVEAMAADLRRHLDLEPIKIRDKSVRYRLGRFVYRYRWGVSATALILLLLASMTVLSIRSNLRIRTALEATQIESSKAREIARFLQELFEVADPFAQKGEQISIEELLENGAQRIANDLADQPEIQSELMFVLARVYNNLGIYKRSSEMLDQTLEIQTLIFGQAHPEIARTLHWQSLVADNMGEYGLSEEKAEAALEMRLLLLERIDPDVGESMDRLGSLLAYSGQEKRAISLSQEASLILLNAVGEEDKRTQTALHNLAWMLGTQGSYEEATPIFEQVIEISTRLVGPEHPLTLETLNNFAVMLRRQGKIERAEGIYREVLTARLRVLGDDHPQVGFSQNNLAKLLQGKGEFEEASVLYAKSLSILKTSYGDEHSNVAISLGNLAQVLLQQGSIDQAEIRYREALAIHRKNTPAGSLKVSSTLKGLGRILTIKGELSEAEPLLREALTIQQRALNADHWETAETQLRLGQLLVLKGADQEARDFLKQSEEALNEYFGEDHELVKEVRNELSFLAGTSPP